MHPGLDKVHTFLVLGPNIIFFKILSKGADIHVENGTVQVAFGMLFGHHGVLDGIHAAHRRTISIAALVIVSGTDALEPRNPFRFCFIRRLDQMTHSRAGRAQHAFKFQARHDIGIRSVVVVPFKGGGIVRTTTRTENHGTHRDLPFHYGLVMFHSTGQAGVHALVTFGAYPAGKTTV